MLFLLFIFTSENKPIVSGDEAHHFNDTNNNIFQASDHLDSSTSIVPLIDMDPNNTKSSSSDMNQFTILDARLLLSDSI